MFTGLTNPTAVRFASDGRVFVAEKSGLLVVFDSLADSTPTVVADLRTQVDDYWDRGLLGLALDPNFPTSPYVYLLYAADAPPGGTHPTWNDACPSPPGPTTDGCVVSGRLVRLQLSGDTITGSPLVLLSDQWCQQFPSHSIGDLVFGPDGYLYVERRRRRELQLRRLRPVRRRRGVADAQEPVRRPAGRGRRDRVRAHSRRRRPAEPEPPPAERSSPSS